MPIRADSIVNYCLLFKCRFETASSSATSVAFLLLSLGSGSIYSLLFLFSNLVKPILISFESCLLAVNNSSLFTEFGSLHFHLGQSHVKGRAILLSVVNCVFSLTNVYSHQVVLLLHVGVELVFTHYNFTVDLGFLVSSS